MLITFLHISLKEKKSRTVRQQKKEFKCFCLVQSILNESINYLSQVFQILTCSLFRYTIWLNFIFVLKFLAEIIEQYFVKDFSSTNKCRCLKLNTLFVQVYYMIRFIFVPIRHELLVNVDFVHFQHKFSSKIPKQLLTECA